VIRATRLVVSVALICGSLGAAERAAGIALGFGETQGSDLVGASEDRKQQILRELFTNTTASVDEIKGVLVSGLDDSSPAVRHDALVALAQRALLRNVPDAQNRYRLERQSLLSMNPRLEQLLEDPDLAVRTAAFEAISTLEWDFLQPGESGRIIRRSFGDTLQALRR
jgi:hypothetical protein